VVDGGSPSSTKEPARFVVTLVDPADIEKLVLPLWHAGMSDKSIPQHIAQRVRWLYEDNPAGRPKTWVVRDGASGGVLGACTVVPRLMEVSGRVYRAGMMVDFIVDPSARVAGPAMALQRAIATEATQHDFAFLFGYPNAKAWPIFARLGYKVLGTTRYWSQPLKRDRAPIERLLGTRFRRLLPGEIGPRCARVTARIAVPLLHALLTAAESVVSTGARLLGGYRAELQELSESSISLPTFGQKGVSIKSSNVDAFRQWRFKQHPTHQLLRLQVTKGETLIAWAVLRVQDGSCEVQDADWVDGHRAMPGLLWWLMSHMLRRGRYRSVLVGLAGTRDVDRTLRSALFLERDLDRRIIFNVPAGADPHLIQHLGSGESWRLFVGELDI
jgi:hypothetical protein